MVANVKKAATVGAAPWWIGTSQDHDQWINLGEEAVTSDFMLDKCGANFGTQLGKMRAEITVDGKRLTTTVPNRFAVVREDTRQVLGTVGHIFELIQNDRSFRFFDEVIGEGQAVYHTAGVLGEGERVWLLAKLPETHKVNGTDLLKNFLLLVNSHDGSGAFHMFFTVVRVVCENTFNVAVNAAERNGSGYRMLHLKGVNGRMNAGTAREALGMATEHMTAFSASADQLAQMPITSDEIEALMQRLIPIPTQFQLAEAQPDKPLLLLPEPKPEDIAPDLRYAVQQPYRRRELVKHLIHHGKGNDDASVAGTRWAAVNGVVEYTDYLVGWDKKRTKSLLFGEGRRMKQKAWNILTSA